jgi:hypothetical protein
VLFRSLNILDGNVDIEDQLNVNGAVDLDSTLDVDGNATFNGDVTIDDVLNLDDLAYTLTGTQTIMPSASFYAMNPGGALTVTLAITNATAGDILIMVNASAFTVTITDTNILTSDGAAVSLGQYDTIMFIFVGSHWYEISRSADS